MTAQIIDGKAVAAKIKEQLAEKVKAHCQGGNRPPCLAVILVGSDPASQVYVNSKKKTCAAIGIDSRSLDLDGNVSQEELEKHLIAFNEDKDVDGILLQLPLPSHLNAERAIDLISPEKDVDGLTPTNQGLLIWKRPGLVSCTPYGIMELIKSTDVNPWGKRAAVIGRSVLVGAPVSNLLSNAGATVMCLNSKTVEPWELTKQADILVVAAGRHHLVDKNWIKPGAVVIDVGIHRIDGKLSGDVDFESAKEVAGHITPVPGGVGPMTIAMLLSNCVTAYEKRLKL